LDTRVPSPWEVIVARAASNGIWTKKTDLDGVVVTAAENLSESISATLSMKVRAPKQRLELLVRTEIRKQRIVPFIALSEQCLIADLQVSRCHKPADISYECSASLPLVTLGS